MGALAGVGALMGVSGSVGNTIAGVRAKDLEAKQLDIAARSQLDQAAFDERQQRRVGSFFMGEAKANTAASGIDASRGSPLFLALDQAKQNELQALSIRRSGQVKYNQLKFASQLKKSEIEGDIIGGIYGAGSAGVSGYSSILSSMGK